MDKIKVLEFDIYGRYGMFRKRQFNNSLFSYPIIPPTAVYGLLGAILGLSNNDDNSNYNYILQQAKVKFAIKTINEISYFSYTTNHLHTKNSDTIFPDKHLPISYKVIENPHYKLFVTMEDEDLFEQLQEKVRNQESVYNMAMGQAQFLAYYGEHCEVREYEQVDSDEYVKITTVIPKSKLQNCKSTNLVVDDYPIIMNNNRIVTNYDYIILEKNNKDLEVKIKGDYWYNAESNTSIVFANEVSV